MRSHCLMQHVSESLAIKFTASPRFCIYSPSPSTGNAIEFEFEFGFEHVAANYFAVQCICGVNALLDKS